jgi:hypothetical protein
VGQFAASLDVSKWGWGRGSSVILVTLWVASGVGFSTPCCLLQYVQTRRVGPPSPQWLLVVLFSG